MLTSSTRPLGRASARARLSFSSHPHHALALALSALCLTPMAQAASTAVSTDDLAQVKRQMDELRQQYEARMKALEDRLLQVQQQAAAQASSAPAGEAFTANAAATPGSASEASPNAFNPTVSVILSGTYASLSKDPNTWKLSGFNLGSDEVGPGSRSFSLGESEVSLGANIDPWFYGALTLSVAGDDTISAEEAFVQTTSLPGGLKVKVGRFFGGLGYLNEQHAHTWDFVDAPLAYQAFLGGQYKQEGVQAKWLLPTDQFVELGAELGNGHSYPGTDRNRNTAGSLSVFAHTGGDVGDSNSWRAGVSWLNTKAKDRTWDDVNTDGDEVSTAFTGDSRIWALDAVWKWAPNGNATRTNFKLQGEYFKRKESGTLTDNGLYNASQSGWYLQGIYQFMPAWRVGMRRDQLDSGTVNLGDNLLNLAQTSYQPSRNSLMLDWSPSEFSRWRLQVNDDRSREGVKDRQLFLQYQMSLGAHGAHSY